MDGYYRLGKEHSITCPRCGAVPGEPCHKPNGKQTYHQTRRKAMMDQDANERAKVFYWRAMKGNDRA